MVRWWQAWPAKRSSEQTGESASWRAAVVGVVSNRGEIRGRREAMNPVWRADRIVLDGSWLGKSLAFPFNRAIGAMVAIVLLGVAGCQEYEPPARVARVSRPTVVREWDVPKPMPPQAEQYRPAPVPTPRATNPDAKSAYRSWEQHYKGQGGYAFGGELREQHRSTQGTTTNHQSKPAAGLHKMPQATAQAAMPPVSGAKGWAVAGPVRGWKWIVIHHSDTEVGSAAAFDRYHREVRHWEGLGYHFVIDNGHGGADGRVEVGPRWTKQKQGAHAGVEAYNDYGIGICLVGNFNTDRPTAAQMNSLVRLVAYLMRTYHIPADHVIGHHDVKHTDCPGRYLSVAMVRRMAAEYGGGMAGR
ncbi:MAG: N-acetylmuramoyl-L-alanine amidase [Bacillota bacterium]